MVTDSELRGVRSKFVGLDKAQSENDFDQALEDIKAFGAEKLAPKYAQAFQAEAAHTRLSWRLWRSTGRQDWQAAFGYHRRELLGVLATILD